MRARSATAPPAAADDSRPGISLSALVAAVAGAMVLALYLWVLLGQEGDSWSTAAPFATLLGCGVLAAAIAAFLQHDAFRIVAAAAAAAVFLAGAILGALSIGFLLVPSALASLVCVSSTGERVGLRATWAAAAAAGGGALGLLVFYLALWL